ncbi:aldo/keto reductase [Mycolicibacterium aichiense]|uniref:Aldo/keto reductase n=2 Tax=Mycolicibacterium aichiense TaxID=1799 RepID=A0AAD1HQM0_9MYCO|nr:aldo/keto reductase [Mycolicibacterium aichiense]MCV7018374.1 aldo/keto reductase [Mycolicibacterium aichiense]BBX08858.1 aldo/keto reductase [Mycolicibacterium aichiense]STZ82652.1 aldo/keto reductase [Mycolicibacterium aichiense]
MAAAEPGGTARLGDRSVARVGYGAMSLESVAVDDAVSLLHRAVELGINHIDTASFYSDGEVNRRIRRALAPYREDVVIVSKVGARAAPGAEVPLTLAQKPAELRASVELDLDSLGLDQIPVVNLRRADIGPGLIADGDQVVNLDDQLAELITLRDEGKIGAIGISNVPLQTVQQALAAEIACVQNAYSLLDRTHEDCLQFCAANDIAWVPYFPLGSGFPGFPKVANNTVVVRIAAERGVTPAQVGLAWLLAHAPNVLLIPGTGSVGHLEENADAGAITLSKREIADLDAIPGQTSANGDGVQPFLDERR